MEARHGEEHRQASREREEARQARVRPDVTRQSSTGESEGWMAGRGGEGGGASLSECSLTSPLTCEGGVSER